MLLHYYKFGEVQPGQDKVIKVTGGAQTLERLVSEANENVPVRPFFFQKTFI